MPAYLIQNPDGNGKTFQNGANAAVVFAADATDAVEIAKSMVKEGLQEALTGATVTEIAAGADLAGWTLRIRIVGASPDIDYTVTGATAATIDSIAALMVTALNGDAQIAGAAYNASTQVLTVAETTDGLGDLTIIAELKPPASTYENPVAVSSFIASQVDGGASGDALTVTFAADANVVPVGYALLSA